MVLGILEEIVARRCRGLFKVLYTEDSGFVHRPLLRTEHNFSETGSIFFFICKYAETSINLGSLQRALLNYLPSGISCIDVLVHSYLRKEIDPVLVNVAFLPIN
jgi:hypothetical protein